MTPPLTPPCHSISASLWSKNCRSGVGGSVRSCGPKTTTMVKEGGWDGDRLRPQHHWWIQTFSPFLFFFFLFFSLFSPCSSRAGRRVDAVSLSKMGLTSSRGVDLCTVGALRVFLFVFTFSVESWKRFSASGALPAGGHVVIHPSQLQSLNAARLVLASAQCSFL